LGIFPDLKDAIDPIKKTRQQLKEELQAQKLDELPHKGKPYDFFYV